VSLHRAARHLKLLGDFAIVTALQQQIRYLLLSKAQLDRLFLHAPTPPGDKIITHTVKGSFAQIPCQKRLSPPNRERNYAKIWAGLQESVALTLPRRARSLSEIVYGFPQAIGEPRGPRVGAEGRFRHGESALVWITYRTQSVNITKYDRKAVYEYVAQFGRFDRVGVQQECQPYWRVPPGCRISGT